MSKSAAPSVRDRSAVDADPRLLAERLQSSLRRRLASLRPWLGLPSADRLEAEPHLAELLAIGDQVDVIDGFEVEEASCTRVDTTSQANEQRVPAAWMRTTPSAATSSSSADPAAAASSASSGFVLSLRSLHPSREFASSHLEARLASLVDDHVHQSRFAWERRAWRLTNYALVDQEPIELVEVHVIVWEEEEANDDDDDGHLTAAGRTRRRIGFRTPIFQSVRFPGALTLRHTRTPDEAASQCAWNEAERDQAAYMQCLPPAERTQSGLRPVLETDYLRMRDVTTFMNEEADSSLASEPSPELLHCLRKLFHQYALPLDLDSLRLLHALTGFEFLRHLLADSPTIHRHLQATFDDPAYQRRVSSAMEQHLHAAMWPAASATPTNEQLKLSSHVRAIVSPSSGPTEDAPSDVNREEEDEVEDVAVVGFSLSFSKLARVAADAASFVDDSLQPSAAFSSPDPSAAVTVAEPDPRQSTTADDASPSTVTGLIVSYLRTLDWTFELERELALPGTTAAASSKGKTSSSSSSSSSKHGKGKSKGRR